MPDTLLNREELLALPAEDYMNEAQRAFFRDLLERQREELRQRIDTEFGALREVEPVSDESDLASREEQRLWQLRLLEREKRLLDKIDQSLNRLASGEYGWCEESGEPIGLRRLLLRPTATLCLEAKQRQEQQERHQRPV
ncbi:RNA polymerase-binding protein DksA [Metapseudomonas lalkuanensis]|uniref:RNA polymerase-binding transcription factor DksA n=1 Tax=Metapseudomonas lalkuanensis TaxID=2604832 RepID=A0A5J6QSH8_9GAMM|nr:RNA polymerase-binding protein DksA [Pseudomonas lalkuanensis]QEY65658.1 RNA polymerase-binding protein DksA [Pseudomonas lalkuanensis]UCO98208.1 RNA polymerase-binding protein DksA [Pseudomonas lalkuanensis]